MQANALNRDPTVVDRYVEYLCEQGCLKVTASIEALRNDEQIPELAGLSAAERSAVLGELVSIMSIYSGACSR